MNEGQDKEGILYWMYFTRTTTGVLRIEESRPIHHKSGVTVAREDTRPDQIEPKGSRRSLKVVQDSEEVSWRELTPPQNPPHRSQQY